VDARADIKADMNVDLHLDMARVYVFSTSGDQENLMLENL